MVFVVLLTLSNLGTSLAAAYLAKDTTTNDEGVLVNSDTNEAVGTQTTADSFGITRTDTDTGQRELCSYDDDQELNACEINSYLMMPKNEADDMINKCKELKTVELKRTFTAKGGTDTTIIVCGPNSGRSAMYQSSPKKATFTNDHGDIIIEELLTGPNTGHYKLYGSELTQNEGQVCDNNADCDNGLICNADAGKCTVDARTNLQDIGVTCTSNYECTSGKCFQTSCVNGACVSDDECDSVKGEFCASECGNSIEGKGPTCTTQSALDAACVISYKKDGVVCNTFTFACQDMA